MEGRKSRLLPDMRKHEGRRCQMGGPWTRPRVGIEIRNLKRAGLPVNVRAVKTRALYAQALRLFGSWKEAVRSAGLDYDKIRIYRRPGSPTGSS
jgi:hypothetical protein